MKTVPIALPKWLYGQLKSWKTSKITEAKTEVNNK